jgi:hypothetical protein
VEFGRSGGVGADSGRKGAAAVQCWVVAGKGMEQCD